MENILSGTEYENLDPSTLLSNHDIIRLLMEYCNKKTAERINYERELTNDKIKLVIHSLGTVAGALATLSTDHEAKIANVALKLESNFHHLTKPSETRPFPC